MKLWRPEHWKEYDLIDSGNLEKLERFGKYVLMRPEPQAVWGKSLSEEEWKRLSHATYKRVKGVNPAQQEGSEKGDWKVRTGMPDQWTIGYDHGKMHLKFRLGLTSFGHVGVFPEQAENWDFIFESVRNKVTGHGSPEGSQTNSREIQPRVLNLFAYTGGASLAAKAAGADVVHVDSVKAVVSWAKELMEVSGLKDIRWVVEDAMKFVHREVKRGNRYDGIILDPPAYGRGPDGEKWFLQESVNEMIQCCSQLLKPESSFFVLSLYSMGFSALIADSLVQTHFGDVPGREFGELFFTDQGKRRLPLGTVVRFSRE
jgi:23S rRNA (cytosine1962-C5)-methyltransferase